MKCTTCSIKPPPKDKGVAIATYAGFGIKETLYKNKDGEYTLYGKGGVCSKYAKRCCGVLVTGSKTSSMTPDQAESWAKENLPEADYTKLFAAKEQIRENAT